MKQEYRPLINLDKPFNVKEPSFGVYKKIKMITLASSSTSQEDKDKIIKEFKLTPEGIPDEIGAAEYYVEIARTLFMGFPGNFDTDDLNIAEINKAELDFFGMLSGN